MLPQGTPELRQLAAGSGPMLAAQPGAVASWAGQQGSAGPGQGQGSHYGGPGASSAGQAAYGGLGARGTLGPGQGVGPGMGTGAAAAHGAGPGGPDSTTNAAATPSAGAQQSYVQGTGQRHMQQGAGQGFTQGFMQGYGQAPGGALAPGAPAAAGALALSHTSASMQQPAGQRPHASMHLLGSQGASWGSHGGPPKGQQAAQQRALQAKPEPTTTASWPYQPAQLVGGPQATPQGSAAALGHAAWALGSGPHAGAPEGTQQGRIAVSAGGQTGAGLLPQRQQPQQAGMVQPGSGSGYAASAPSQAVLQAHAATHGQAQAQLLVQPLAWQQEAPAATTARPQAHVQLQAGYALSQQQSALQAQTQAGSGAGSQQGFHAPQIHRSAPVQGSAPARISQPQNPSSWQQGPGGHNASAGSANPLALFTNAAAYGNNCGPASGRSMGAAARGSGDVKRGVRGVDGSYSQAATAGGAGYGSAAAAHGVGGSAAYSSEEALGANAAAYGRSVAGLHCASSTALHGSGAGASAGGLGSHGGPGGYAVGGPWGPQHGSEAPAGTGDAHQAGAPMQSTVYYPQHGQYAGAQQQVAPVAAAAPYTSNPNPAPHALGGSAPGHGQGSYPIPGPAYAQGFLQQRGAGACGAGGGSQGAQNMAAASAYPGFGPPFGQPAVQAGAAAAGKPNSDPYQAHAGGGVQWGQAPAQRQWSFQ